MNTNKCTMIYWCSLMSKYPPTCFGQLCGHLQGSINKNIITITITKCQNHPTIENNHKIRVKKSLLKGSKWSTTLSISHLFCLAGGLLHTSMYAAHYTMILFTTTFYRCILNLCVYNYLLTVVSQSDYMTILNCGMIQTLL